MKRFVLFTLLILEFILSNAQKTWDGGGDGTSWSDANNWSPNGVPISTDNVLLDNSVTLTSYIVILPSTAVTTSVSTLTITPSTAVAIQLTIPSANTGDPGLSITGTGDALVLNNRAVLMNSTGVASGGIGLSITNTFRINNGAKYVHNNARGNADIVSQLSAAVGTENGTFEFDVPGNGAYIISLSGRTFGNLVLSNTTVAARTYTGNGASDLIIRGNLIISTNAVFNITMTADIFIAGNLDVTGNFDLSPSTGATGRSLLFNGSSNQIISGAGNFTFGDDFHNIHVTPGSIVTLQRNIDMGTAQYYHIEGRLNMGTNVVFGAAFYLHSGATIGIGSADGITSSPTASGNVQTIARDFQVNASYEYNGTVAQITGTGLPATITGKLIINSSAGLGTNGVTQTQATAVNGEFVLTEGKYTTGPMPNILYIGSTAITTAAYTDNSFVNGVMCKYGNTPYRFPVGKGVDIHPCQLETTGGNAMDLYTVEYFKANPSGPAICFPGTPGVSSGIDHVSKLEYWAIQSLPTGGPNPSNRITLYASTYTYATDRSRLVIARCSGTWDNRGNLNTSNTGATGDVTSLLSSNGNFFNYFTFASIDPLPVNPLPIDLISFDASKLSPTSSTLNWELSACCAAAARFEIQRANAGKSFSTITTVNGNETARFYNYNDNELKKGINYYRLKMTDADGKVTYSRVAAVMNGVNGLVFTSLIPTVTTGRSTLTVASSSQHKLDLMITDMQGRVMQKRNYTLTAGNTNIELSLEKLSAGVYQLIGIAAEGKTNIIRFIKQ